VFLKAIKKNTQEAFQALAPTVTDTDIKIHYFGKKIDKIGRDSGASPEEFSKDLRTEFKRVGGNEEALEKGEQRQITKLNEAAENLKEKAGRVGEKGEETLAKRQPVATEETRLEKRTAEEKELAERVSKKPVEEFTKEKPVTKAQKRQREEVNTVKNEIRKAENKVAEIKNIRTETPPVSKEGKANLEIAEKNAQRQLESLKQDFKDIKETIEAKKPKPPSDADTEVYLQRHLAELKEMAEKPGGETDRRYQVMFERDQKYIDRAQKLIESGELPPPKYIDTYVKILDHYDTSYKKMLGETQKALRDLEKPKTIEQKAAKKRLEKLEKDLLKNKDINNSKQLIQKQKNFIKEKFRGPGRTFFKKYLQDLKVQSKNLRKSFFEYNKEMGGQEAKINRIGQEAMRQEVKALVEKPTETNIRRFAEKVGLDPVEVKEAVETGEKLSKEVEAGVKKGLPFEKILSKLKKIFT
ncbi:hypothetical protein LCGC14_2592000, partial [marine sediment metagenome]